MTWNEYLVRRYGTALQRVPVDLGFGCPNRDERGKGGCLFCAEDGGRARQVTGIDEPALQVQQGSAFARRRYGATRFMLYIQAYTGTFAEPELFRKILAELLTLESFDAVSIGTRPDCLPDGVLEYLAELNREREGISGLNWACRPPMTGHWSGLTAGMTGRARDRRYCGWRMPD